MDANKCAGQLHDARHWLRLVCAESVGGEQHFIFSRADRALLALVERHVDEVETALDAMAEAARAPLAASAG